MLGLFRRRREVKSLVLLLIDVELSDARGILWAAARALRKGEDVAASTRDPEE
jgi:hypothetical protein